MLKSGRVFSRWTGPVRGPTGTEYGRLWCFRDVTERHKIEADRAILTDRMASMGRLAAGVGHEINNPLAYTIGNLDWLAQMLHSNLDQPAELPVAELLETVESSREGLGRIRVIVRDLQTLARADEETKVALDVEQLLEQSIQIAANEVKHRARLVRRYGAAPRVRGNVARLSQVFLNLLLNAVQAIPEGRAADNVIQVAIFGQDGHAVIEISDSGVGIAPDHLERIFDLFFTTKEVGAGTGLGLSICQGIVEQHGGTIAVRSQLGEGTTFAVTLPGYVAPATAAAEPAAPPQISFRARVLVIDDEPAINRMVQRHAGKAHQVTTTTTARDALAHLARGDHYDVILCDLMMPDQTGMDVYEQICRDHPALARCVVFMTGGAFTERAEAFLASVANSILSKPFSSVELSQAIDRAASGGRAA
jgi:nitrogen-specific signal transduction histidine kinase/ActR/RegA family two-component response regulator